MLALWLLVLTISIGTILLLIHDQDEIHLLMVWLSAILGFLCVLVLISPLFKALLGLVFFAIGHKIFPVHNSFR